MDENMTSENIQIGMPFTKTPKKVGRPKGHKMGAYQLDLQKRAHMQRVNEESAKVMFRLCRTIQSLMIRYPDTPFLYNDFPYLTPSSGGTLCTPFWVREYADAYSYVFKPNTVIIRGKLKAGTAKVSDLNKIWFDRVNSETASKLFPDSYAGFYKRFGERRNTTMVFADYLFNSMLSRPNTAIYPLNIDFYRKFLESAMQIAKEFPATHYARLINSNARDLFLEFEMDPFKYEINGAETYFRRHNDITGRKSSHENKATDLFGKALSKCVFAQISFEPER